MKGILFDMDGTLLDTLDDLTAAANVALKEFGCPLRDREEIRHFVGNGVRRLMELAVPEGMDEAAFEACFGRMRSYYDAHSAEATAPYEGVQEMLAALKEKGIPMALVSNKPDPLVAELAQIHFPGIFAVTVGESPQRARKPAPDMPLYALEQLGLSKEEVFYVGDSEVDVQTARNAGVPVVSVTWGFRDREMLEQLKPEQMIDRPAQLLELI